MNYYKVLDKNTENNRKNYFSPFDPKRAGKMFRKIRNEKIGLSSSRLRDSSLGSVSKECENTNFVSLPKLPLIKKLENNNKKEFSDMIDLSSRTIHMFPRSFKQKTKNLPKLSQKKTELTTSEKSSQTTLTSTLTSVIPPAHISKIVIHKKTPIKSLDSPKHNQEILIKTPDPVNPPLADHTTTNPTLKKIIGNYFIKKKNPSIEKLDISGW